MAATQLTPGRLRVAIVHDLPAGGARRRLGQQVAQLDADVVEICLGDASPVTTSPVVIQYAPRADRARRSLRPPLRYLDMATLRLAWSRAGAALRRARPDVVYANPCRHLNAPPALLAAGVPSLYFCDEPHLPPSDPDRRASRNSSTRALYAPLYEWQRRLDRATTLAATRIATNSRFTAGRIEAIYGRGAQVLPMGVPAGFTPGSAPPAHLLSVGSLLPDKGHEQVIAAAAAARARWPVVVVAPRPDRAAGEALRRLATELGVEFELRVGISDAELVDLYRRAFATLYLAREEPFGLASLEAQACGSPVIVSDRGGLPETLRDGVSGWVIPRDARAAARRLDELGDPELRARMVRAAADHGAGASWASAGAALAAILAELGGRGSGRGA